MSKERLEEADEWLYGMRCLLSVKTDEEDRAYTQKRIDLFNWLIKQAELGLIHQEQFHDMQTKNLQLQKQVYELEATIHQDEIQAVLEGLYEQNKRYREAIEKAISILKNVPSESTPKMLAVEALIKSLEEYK